MSDNCITIINDNGDKKNFYIFDETKLQGTTYYIAADNFEDTVEDDDIELDEHITSEIVILKEVGMHDDDIDLELVVDEEEIEAVLQVFQEQMDRREI